MRQEFITPNYSEYVPQPASRSASCSVRVLNSRNKSLGFATNLILISIILGLGLAIYFAHSFLSQEAAQIDQMLQRLDNPEFTGSTASIDLLSETGVIAEKSAKQLAFRDTPQNSAKAATSENHFNKAQKNPRNFTPTSAKIEEAQPEDTKSDRHPTIRQRNVDSSQIASANTPLNFPQGDVVKSQPQQLSQELPRDLYSIAGQVLSETGQSVAGIEVVAIARRLFDGHAGSAAKTSAVEQRTFTDNNGYFLFQNLANGEYELRTVAVANYIAASLSVRAGVDSAQLVVIEQREIWVNGYVTDNDGEGVTDVSVFSTGSNEAVAISESNGTFRFPLTVRSDRGYLITLLAEGYQEKKLSLTRKDWQQHQQAELEIILQPLQALTMISGTVRNSTGELVAGEQIYLQHLQTKYKTVTDDSGNFVINDVESGSNYTLWIVPKGLYKEYRRKNLKIPSNGLNGFDIVLETVGAGNIAGQIIDTEGQPIPDFTLTVRNGNVRHTSLQVTSDQEGYFSLQEIPDGRLRFESRSFPRFVTSGIQLAENDEQIVELILDMGQQQINGKVIDHAGNPVAAADITLSWILREQGLVHESLRKTKSSADGNFLFTQLGNGARMLIVKAPGFQTAKLEDQQTDGTFANLEVQLNPAIE